MKPVFLNKCLEAELLWAVKFCGSEKAMLREGTNILPVPHLKKMGRRELIIVPGKVGQGTCPCVPFF